MVLEVTGLLHSLSITRTVQCYREHFARVQDFNLLAFVKGQNGPPVPTSF